MSLFDKDLVERSIDYSDDPEENMEIQIILALRRFNTETKEPSRGISYKNSAYYIRIKISNFMYDLFNGHIPKGFLGPFKKIKSYRITIQQDLPIIKVIYQFKDINEYKEIQFLTDPLLHSKHE